MSNLRDTYKLGVLVPKDTQLSVELRGSVGNLGLVTKTPRPPLTTDSTTVEQHGLGRGGDMLYCDVQAVHFFALLFCHSCHRDRMYLCPPIVGPVCPLYPSHALHQALVSH